MTTATIIPPWGKRGKPMDDPIDAAEFEELRSLAASLAPPSPEFLEACRRVVESEARKVGEQDIDAWAANLAEESAKFDD